MIKLWVDDVRPAPKGYIWLKSVKGAETLLLYFKYNNSIITNYNSKFNMLETRYVCAKEKNKK